MSVPVHTLHPMTELILKCPHVVTITEEEHDRLELLDDAAHEVEWDLCCALQGNHPGPHITLGQAAGNDEWWVRWSGTAREIVKLPGCAAKTPTDLCFLPEDHYGAHSYELSTRCVPLD